MNKIKTKKRKITIKDVYKRGHSFTIGHDLYPDGTIQLNGFIFIKDKIHINDMYNNTPFILNLDDKTLKDIVNKGYDVINDKVAKALIKSNRGFLFPKLLSEKTKDIYFEVDLNNAISLIYYENYVLNKPELWQDYFLFLDVLFKDYKKELGKVRLNFGNTIYHKLSGETLTYLYEKKILTNKDLQVFNKFKENILFNRVITEQKLHVLFYMLDIEYVFTKSKTNKFFLEEGLWYHEEIIQNILGYCIYSLYKEQMYDVIEDVISSKFECFVNIKCLDQIIMDMPIFMYGIQCRYTGRTLFIKRTEEVNSLLYVIKNKKIPIKLLFQYSHMGECIFDNEAVTSKIEIMDLLIGPNRIRDEDKEEEQVINRSYSKLY